MPVILLVAIIALVVGPILAATAIAVLNVVTKRTNSTLIGVGVPYLVVVVLATSFAYALDAVAYR